MPSIRKKKSLFTLPALNSKVKSANVKFPEIFFGYLLRVRDLVDHARFCTGIQSQVQHNAQPVSSLCG